MATHVKCQQPLEDFVNSSLLSCDLSLVSSTLKEVSSYLSDINYCYLKSYCLKFQISIFLKTSIDKTF